VTLIYNIQLIVKKLYIHSKFKMKVIMEKLYTKLTTFFPENSKFEKMMILNIVTYHLIDIKNIYLEFEVVALRHNLVIVIKM
jgi:hypothetical protein